MNNKAYIIGVGPGSPDYVYPYARKKIEESGIIVGWELDILPVKELTKGKKVFLQKGDNYLNIPDEAAEEARKTGKTVALLKLGDPLVSPAGLDKLLNTFNDFDIEIIPGISTVQLAAAKSGVTLDESVIIVFHAADDGSIDLEDLSKRLLDMVEALTSDKNILILNDIQQMPRQTAEYLIKQGISRDTKVIVYENLSLKDERMFRSTLGEVSNIDFSWQSVMVVKRLAK